MSVNMKFFEFKHLPEHLGKISQPFHHMAHNINDSVPDGAEKSAGLRKLLEAKDCIVRAVLEDA